MRIIRNGSRKESVDVLKSEFAKTTVQIQADATGSKCPKNGANFKKHISGTTSDKSMGSSDFDSLHCPEKREKKNCQFADHFRPEIESEILAAQAISGRKWSAN